MGQGDDIGPVDAHELLRGELLHQALEAVQHHQGSGVPFAVNLDVFAHALHIHNLFRPHRHRLVIRLKMQHLLPGLFRGRSGKRDRSPFRSRFLTFEHGPHPQVHQQHEHTHNHAHHLRLHGPEILLSAGWERPVKSVRRQRMRLPEKAIHRESRHKGQAQRQIGQNLLPCKEGDRQGIMRHKKDKERKERLPGRKTRHEGQRKKHHPYARIQAHFLLSQSVHPCKDKKSLLRMANAP